MLYLCKEKKTNLEYRVIEYKHKDRIDVILNTIKKHTIKKKENTLTKDSEIDQNNPLTNYLKNNPNGVTVELMNGQAILLDNKLEKKLFFSDSDFISSHELIISGTDSTIVKYYFTKVVESLMLKKENINKVF